VHFTLAAMFIERRSTPREAITLKVRMASGALALTRNVAPTGLYLQMPLSDQLDEWIALELELKAARLRFRACGQVLRRDRGSQWMGVALKLYGQRLLLSPAELAT
jgi:hypothetical protein